MKTPTLQELMGATSKRDDDGLRASYNISLMIAKSGKTHTISEELILLVISEVIRYRVAQTSFRYYEKNSTE